MDTALKAARAGVLVIHGIGEQNPYETIDQFSVGIFDFLRRSFGDVAGLGFKKVQREGWTEVGIQIELKRDAADQDPQQIDIFEYYWAPKTQGRVTFLQTLRWLLRTDLSPLRNLSSNLAEMAKARDVRTGKKLAWLFFREMRRILLLYLPLAAGLIWLIANAANVPSVGSVLAPLAGIFQREPWWALPGSLVAYGLALFLVVFALRLIWRASSRQTRTIQAAAETVWLILATALSLVFYWGGGWFMGMAQDEVTLAQLWQEFIAGRTHLLLVVALAYPTLRYVIVKFVGDVEVYVTADANSESYEARREILAGSTASLERLLKDKTYDRVVLAGHSLGSVIAYDTINKLVAQATAGPIAGEDGRDALTVSHLRKLKGLITFGSPLDKIHYFFRQHVKEDQPIRAQILSMLHPFRKLSSNRDYGDYRIEYEVDQMKGEDGLVWLNAYSPTDPVSGRLHFYDLEDGDQKWFWYWIPGVAHMGYWDDPDFYDWWCGRLLVGTKGRQGCGPSGPAGS